MKKNSLEKKAPILKHFVNFWTLIHQPTAAKEWSLEERFKHIKRGGFDAIAAPPDPSTLECCQRYGLDYLSGVDANGKTYQAKLDKVKTINPVRVNVQLCDHDTLPKESIKVWLKLEAYAQKLGLNVDLEVHRDTCTETPEKVYEIAALYKKATGKKIRFCWDYSHIAVVKHISPPYAPRLLERPDLIQLSRQVHFRPFNGHHCQIPATDGKGNETPEFKDYLQFVDDFLACWLKGARGGEVLYACPEFGPVSGGYGLTSFPDVWKDAIYLRARIEEIWQANLKKCHSFTAG